MRWQSVKTGFMLDGTFGRGGHSRLILSRLGEQGRLVVFDKDPEAIAVANELAAQDKRVSVVHNGFETFQTALDELGIDKIDGALFDWGFRRHKLTMADADSVSALMRRWICGWIRLAGCLQQNGLHRIRTGLHEVIKNYGEERFSRQIARTIVAQREESPIDTTPQAGAACGAKRPYS